MELLQNACTLASERAAVPKKNGVHPWDLLIVSVALCDPPDTVQVHGEPLELWHHHPLPGVTDCEGGEGGRKRKILVVHIYMHFCINYTSYICGWKGSQDLT